MHQDLLQLQAYQNPSMTKNARPKTAMILKSPWLMPWDTLTKIAHFSELLLSHDPLFGQKWPKQLWTKRPTLSKQILTWEEMLQLGRPFMVCVVARSRQTMKKNKKQKKQKKNWLSCHALEKFELSLNESQESQVKKNVEKMMKNRINTNNFPCKELLFSLGSYVRDDKWTSFIILLL